MKQSVPALLITIEKELQSTFTDTGLCTQYAWWLLQAITHLPQITLISMHEIEWGKSEQEQLTKALHALMVNHMPIAYLLGTTPFAALDIIVRPPILIPRPETEEWCVDLIEKLRKACPKEQLTILDLCTGTGCVALALADALPHARVYGIDISPEAFALAEENKNHNGITNVTFLRSDCFDQIHVDQAFDLIVANPPYIKENAWISLDPSVKEWEDKGALIAPDNGLQLIKRIIDQAPAYLRNNQCLAQEVLPQLVIEIDYDQGEAVADYLAKRGYNQINIRKDLEGKNRVASGRVDHVARKKKK